MPPFAQTTSALPKMSTYLSSLRRLLPTSQSEENDLTITNPEDSHVSRVLRNYYNEKGRPYPPWLGPDPSAPTKAPPALLNSNSSSNISAGSLRRAPASSSSGGSGGLGDLFADSNQPQISAANSLRARRPGIRSPGFKGGSSDSIPYPARATPPPPPSSSSSSDAIPYPQRPGHRHTGSNSNGSSSSTPTLSTQPLPLPSQRLGSYQARAAPVLEREFSGSGSVQERLRARLGGSGGRGATVSRPGSAGGNPYEGGVGKGGFGSNEGGGAGGKNLYASAGDERESGGSGGGQPFVGASSPWVSGDDPGLSGYGGGGSGLGRRAVGLPGSPRRRG